MSYVFQSGVLRKLESFKNFWAIYETKYSRMDEVKFVEDSL